MIEVMIVYHEIEFESLESALAKGLKRSSRGEKGDTSDIIKTDCFLDEQRPKGLSKAGVSRDDNLYAFMATDGKVISITDGSAVDINTFVKNSSKALLELSVPPQHCYVSDLNAYDAVKKAVENKADEATLRILAKRYWEALQPMKTFKTGSIRRPEVMITKDIPPKNITLVSGQ